jgi:hypothetical protein
MVAGRMAEAQMMEMQTAEAPWAGSAGAQALRRCSWSIPEADRAHGGTSVARVGGAGGPFAHHGASVRHRHQSPERTQPDCSRRCRELLHCETRAHGPLTPNRVCGTDQRARTPQPTGSSSRGGGCGSSGRSTGGGRAATSSTRRPSGRSSGVPHRLHDITAPSSVHFQHVGQQTLIATTHSRQRNPGGCAASDRRCQDRDRFGARHRSLG